MISAYTADNASVNYGENNSVFHSLPGAFYGAECALPVWTDLPIVAAVMEKTERLLMDKKWIACAFMVDKSVYNLIYFKLPIMLTNVDYFIHCLIVFCACN